MFEEGHATAAARNQHSGHSSTLQQIASRLLQRPHIVSDLDAGKLLDLRFIRCAGGQPAISEEVVSRVDQDRNSTAPLAGGDGFRQNARKFWRDESGPIVGNQHGVRLIGGFDGELCEGAPSAWIVLGRHLTIDPDDLLFR